MVKSPKIDCPMRFAHRGLVQYAPENTIPCYQAAIDFGCEGIELDMRRSKDGEVIVVHDKDFTRMTRGKVTTAIADMTVEEIKAVELPYAGHLLPHDPTDSHCVGVGSVAVYTDEEVAEQEKTDNRITHLSTFAELDKWFETVPEHVFLELEICAPGVVIPLFEVLWQSKNCDRYIVFSGDEGHNKELQAYIRRNGKPKGLHIGANLWELNDKTRAFIEQSDLYEVGINEDHDGRICTKEDVDWLKERGILAFSNLGDRPEWWEKLEQFGFAAFKTNYAEAYTEWKVNRDKQ